MFPWSVPADITYMRYYKDNKVLRVARVAGGMVLALYPTKSPKFFSYEGFHEVDDNTKLRKISRKKVGDSILLELLDGEPIEKILASRAECAGLHVDLPRDTDHFRVLDAPTFKIAEDHVEA